MGVEFLHPPDFLWDCVFYYLYKTDTYANSDDFLSKSPIKRLRLHKQDRTVYTRHPLRTFYWLSTANGHQARIRIIYVKLTFRKTFYCPHRSSTPARRVGDGRNSWPDSPPDTTASSQHDCSSRSVRPSPATTIGSGWSFNWALNTHVADGQPRPPPPLNTRSRRHTNLRVTVNTSLLLLFKSIFNK